MTMGTGGQREGEEILRSQGTRRKVIGDSFTWMLKLWSTMTKVGIRV